MAATGKLKARFTIPRRGGTQNWSSSFHLDTAVPDLTTFEDLCDQFLAVTPYNLMSCFYDDVELVGFDYYAAGSDIATYTKAESTSGGLTHSDDELQSSDSVSLWRWATSARTTKNHPVYLFNYMHGVRWKSGTAADLVDSNQQTAQQGFCNELLAGIVANSLTFHRAGPNGAVATAVTVEDYIRHRDFPK